MAGPLNDNVARGDRVLHGIAAALVAGMFVASVLQADGWRLSCLPPVGGGEGSTLCLLRRVTGLPCATCGMTRSFCAVSRGDLREAIALHPLGPVLYAVFALVMVRSGWIALADPRSSRGRAWRERSGRALLWSMPVLIAVTVVVWVARLWAIFSTDAAGEAWRVSPLGRLISLLG